MNCYYNKLYFCSLCGQFHHRSQHGQFHHKPERNFTTNHREILPQTREISPQTVEKFYHNQKEISPQTIEKFHHKPKRNFTTNQREISPQTKEKFHHKPKRNFTTRNFISPPTKLHHKQERITILHRMTSVLCVCQLENKVFTSSASLSSSDSYSILPVSIFLLCIREGWIRCIKSTFPLQ